MASGTQGSIQHLPLCIEAVSNWLTVTSTVELLPLTWFSITDGFHADPSSESTASSFRIGDHSIDRLERFLPILRFTDYTLPNSLHPDDIGSLFPSINVGGFYACTQTIILFASCKMWDKPCTKTPRESEFLLSLVLWSIFFEDL